MKLLTAITLLLGLTALEAWGQGAQAEMVKQRAKALQQQNNINQGITQPPPAPVVAPPPAPAVPAAPRGMDPAQQLLVDKLQADLAAIRPGTPVTAPQQQQLADDALALARGSVHPAKEVVAKMAADLAATLGDQNVTDKDPAQLAKDVNVVVNSMNLSAAQVQAFVNAAQTALKSGGATEAQHKAVTDDLKAIVADIQKNKPKLYQ